MLPLAAGGFIYIAGSDLVPELNKESTLGKSWFDCWLLDGYRIDAHIGYVGGIGFDAMKLA